MRGGSMRECEGGGVEDCPCSDTSRDREVHVEYRVRVDYPVHVKRDHHRSLTC